jgi:GNAT superfamily N-acetyltransferase
MHADVDTSGMSIEYQADDEAFEVRPATSDDGDGLADLYANSPDTGDIGMAPRFKIDPYVAHVEMDPASDTHGIVAETPNGDLAGAGFVTFIDTRVGGEIRPTAYLAGLAVHEEYRGRGLGKRLAAERVQYAQEQHGEDCVVFAQIQTGNGPSKAVAETWADGLPYQTVVVPMQPLDEAPNREEYTVRSATDAEYGTVVRGMNEFYADAEMYSPYTVDELEMRLENSPISEPIADYSVVVSQGEIVAGAGVINSHELMWTEIESLPPELEEEDELPPAFPESREIKPTGIADLWYAPGHAAAGEALIEAIRARPDVGNRIGIGLDPDGPVGRLVDTDGQTWEMHMAIRGLEEPEEGAFVAPST